MVDTESFYILCIDRFFHNHDFSTSDDGAVSYWGRSIDHSASSDVSSKKPADPWFWQSALMVICNIWDVILGSHLPVNVPGRAAQVCFELRCISEQVIRAFWAEKRVYWGWLEKWAWVGSADIQLAICHPDCKPAVIASERCRFCLGCGIVLTHLKLDLIWLSYTILFKSLWSVTFK